MGCGASANGKAVGGGTDEDGEARKVPVPLPPAVAEALTEQFHVFDLGEKGTILLEESSICLKMLADDHFKICEDHIRRSYARLDRQRRGWVSLQDWFDHYTELYSGTFESPEVVEKAVNRITKMSRHVKLKTSIPETAVKQLEEMFKICDKDGKGYITVEEDRQMTEAMGFAFDEEVRKRYFTRPDEGEPYIDMKMWLTYFKVALLQAILAEGRSVNRAGVLVGVMRSDFEKSLSGQEDSNSSEKATPAAGPAAEAASVVEAEPAEKATPPGEGTSGATLTADVETIPTDATFT